MTQGQFKRLCFWGHFFKYHLKSSKRPSTFIYVNNLIKMKIHFPVLWGVFILSSSLFLFGMSRSIPNTFNAKHLQFSCHAGSCLNLLRWKSWMERVTPAEEFSNNNSVRSVFQWRKTERHDISKLANCWFSSDLRTQAMPSTDIA